MIGLPAVAGVSWCAPTAAVDEDSPQVPNMFATTGQFTVGERTVVGLRVPDGFHISLFAAEPDVQQPISITTDDRDRLWSAEYAPLDRTGV